jgi:predicted chitinase
MKLILKMARLYFLKEPRKVFYHSISYLYFYKYLTWSKAIRLNTNRFLSLKNLRLVKLSLMIIFFSGCSQIALSSSIPPLSAKDFNNLFPKKNSFYNYSSFVKAVNNMSQIKIKVERRGNWIYKITKTSGNKQGEVVRQDIDWNQQWAKNMQYSSVTIDYADFCSESKTSRKELAAFFAHIAHETRRGITNSYDDGLMAVHELDTTLTYVVANKTYPAVANKKYYGRGPLQLSYNGNYGAASEVLFGNKNVLLENPEIIETDSVVAFESAIYFWMTPEGNKPSAHDAMVKEWIPSTNEDGKGYNGGFGLTIDIINGALECGMGENQLAMNDRIGFYRYFLKQIGAVDNNCSCSCGNMRSFGF